MTSVHVVVDALSVHHGGGATYLCSQLDALHRVAPSMRLRIEATPTSAALLPTELDADVHVHALEHGARRVLWEQTVLARRSVPRGVLYNPGGVAALGPHRMPTVLALQNPNFFGPGTEAAHNQAWYRRSRGWLMRRSAQRADRLVAVSQSFADAIVADLPALRSRVSVIPSGAPSLPGDRRRPAGLAEDHQGFVLSLANDAPHKQLDLVVHAWAKAADASERHGQAAPTLVMAGRRTSARRAHLRQLVPSLLRDRLVQLGEVADRREVAWLLEHAGVVVAASTLESFGFTTAEAGSVGCPVIASDIPAHREVAGDHARYVPAGDEQALADALDVEWSSPTTSRTPWQWPVSWDEHAHLLAEVLTEVADGTTSHAPTSNAGPTP